MIKTIDNTGIKNIVKNTIPDLNLKKIILFGSRARNDFVTESDYDLLIILDEKLSLQEKRKISSLIRKAFALKFIDADVIVKNNNEISNYKERYGSVVKNALEEGVLI